MHIHSYLSNAEIIIKQYDGSAPFAQWLKAYFKQYKKFGSKDRRHIAHACFCYFRLGSAFANFPVQERLKLGLFLCAENSNEALAAISEVWNSKAHLPIAEKLQLVNAGASVTDFFPFNTYLSKAIDVDLFNQALLLQPKVYLRIRPGKHQKVFKKFSEKVIAYELISDNCIAVESQTKVEEVLELDTDAVVQDANSQRVAEPLLKDPAKGKIKVWDCCAASGGKSILIMDTLPGVQLTVSDVRQSILHNLHKRFAKAGITNYRWFVGDASKMAPPQNEKFDVIICDAPRSGSGTWGRTPEQLQLFTADKIDYYAGLQKDIVANAYKGLKSGGQLLYITCSVFEKENEAVVNYMQENLPLRLHEAHYYKGYNMKADTLFAALFTLL